MPPLTTECPRFYRQYSIFREGRNSVIRQVSRSSLQPFDRQNRDILHNDLQMDVEYHRRFVIGYICGAADFQIGNIATDLMKTMDI